MKDTIYLVCSDNKVERVVKRQSSALELYKGEVPIKLTVEIPDTNFKPPFIEKHMIVDRWDKNIAIDDIHFEGDFVTEEEAAVIRQMRLDKMKDTLESQGYAVTKLEE